MGAHSRSISLTRSLTHSPSYSLSQRSFTWEDHWLQNQEEDATSCPLNGKSYPWSFGDQELINSHVQVVVFPVFVQHFSRKSRSQAKRSCSWNEGWFKGSTSLKMNTFPIEFLFQPSQKSANTNTYQEGGSTSPELKGEACGTTKHGSWDTTYQETWIMGCDMSRVSPKWEPETSASLPLPTPNGYLQNDKLRSPQAVGQ